MLPLLFASVAFAQPATSSVPRACAKCDQQLTRWKSDIQAIRAEILDEYGTVPDCQTPKDCLLLCTDDHQPAACRWGEAVLTQQSMANLEKQLDFCVRGLRGECTRGEIPAHAQYTMERGPQKLEVWRSVDEGVAVGATGDGEAAVAIGISTYSYLPPVPFADRDADAFAAWATETRGIPAERVHRVDADADAIVAAVTEAGKQGNRWVWVFFSGHGTVDSHGREPVLLGKEAPRDAIDLELGGVPMSQLVDKATASGARALFVVDASFNGKTRLGDDIVDGAMTATVAYTPAKSGQVVQWFAASPTQSTVNIAGARHGAFSYLVLGALRGWADGELGTTDGKVDVAEANAFVKRWLADRIEQPMSPTWLVKGGPKATPWVLAEGTLEARKK